MESYFSISEAAKIVGLTSETLRHYDRIDLVKPCKKDQWSGYRYYSEQEIVRLNTIQALRCMDLSLKEIKKVLEYDNLEEIVEFLKRAEQKANQKIEQLKYAKSKIQLARADYEKKQNGKQMHHDIFYQQTNDLQKQNYLFEDLAGIYTKDGKTLVRVAALKKNVRIVDGCENICTSAFLYTPLGLNWEAKLRKHIDNLFIPKTVKNIDEKSYITYESEPEKITSEERAKVQKGAVTINNIQIENKNFDVNILSKLLDKVTCNKDEVLKQLTAK